MASDWLFDGVLISLLILLAIAAMITRHLLNSIVLFIAFGLMLALTWARLGAPDLALAEAAIGAGLTGVLLLAASAQSGQTIQQQHIFKLHWPALMFIGSVLVWLILAVLPLANYHSKLPELSQQFLSESGVSHPTTAVLLNFRAWDTLLELLVLLLAFLGVRQLRIKPYPLPTAWPLLASWGRLLAPLIIVTGGYLLWRGTAAPGGAFQSGALLAAGAILLHLTGVLPALSWRSVWLRLLILSGFTLFLAVAIVTAISGNGWLDYPTQSSGALILFIEIAATVSIATALTWLIVGEQAPS